MAKFGTIHTAKGNARTTALLAVAKANNLDIDVVEHVFPITDSNYLLLNHLGKVPTFVGADGYILSECIAVAIYLTSQNEKTTLLGKTKQDYASILKWLSFANTEILPKFGAWYRPIVGIDPYNKKNVEDAQKASLKAVHVLEEHLLVNTYLVGERLTLADLFTVALLIRGFENFFDKKWREQNPNISRWYETVYSQPIYSSVASPIKLVETALENKAPAKPKDAAPKKEAKKETKKETPKPKAKEVEADDEDEAPAAPKAKHPIEELGRATFVLDDWKRKYSNEETREVALPWFWESIKWDEYSIWRVDYKYNDELTQVFMTSNLVGGFFTRLEASRKYLFGAASVYGKANDSVIQGAFVVRGQDAVKAFDVAPDFESYEFTKLDPKKAEDRTFVDDQWSWDKPVEVKGKTYEWADGKVFK